MGNPTPETARLTLILCNMVAGGNMVAGAGKGDKSRLRRFRRKKNLGFPRNPSEEKVGKKSLEFRPPLREEGTIFFYGIAV